MCLSGKYEAPENCSLTHYANLNGDNPEIHLIGSIPFSLQKQKQPRQTVLAVSFSGAGDGNRTRVLGLGSPHNSHYTTPAFASIILLRCPFSKGFRGFL